MPPDSNKILSPGRNVTLFTVARVCDIPNVADLEQLNGVYVAYDKMGTANDSGTLVTPSFEVTETTDVVIGFLTSLAKGNSYFKVTELKLILE